MIALSEVKNAIRNPYAWPGGYPKYFIMEDGGALSINSARENFSEIVSSHLLGIKDGWMVAGVDINWEDAELCCDHSNELIESAYG